MSYKKKQSQEDENVDTVITLFGIIMTTSLIEVYLLLTALEQIMTG